MRRNNSFKLCTVSTPWTFSIKCQLLDFHARGIVKCYLPYSLPSSVSLSWSYSLLEMSLQLRFWYLQLCPCSVVCMSSSTLAKVFCIVRFFSSNPSFVYCCPNCICCIKIENIFSTFCVKLSDMLLKSHFWHQLLRFSQNIRAEGNSIINVSVIVNVMNCCLIPSKL